MCFVGRENDIVQIKEVLTEGNNVIILGKHGIGRTNLIRHIAKTTKDRWRFIFMDFSRTPGEIRNHLLSKLFPMQEFGRRHTEYRSSRFRIATLALDDRRKHILVLNNISKLYTQKRDSLRYLAWEKRFQFVSTVESFLSLNDLFLFRVQMNLSILIMLQYLTTSDVVHFIIQLSKEHPLGWTEVRIKNLAEVTGGYPLRMREIALRELEQSGMDH